MISKATHGRTIVAFCLCVFCVAAMDWMLEALKPSLGMVDHSVDQESWFRFSRFVAMKPYIEVICIAIISGLAFWLARPSGITSNEFNLAALFLVAMTIGRSFFGLGEGFSTSFSMVAVPGIVLGLVTYAYLQKSRS